MKSMVEAIGEEHYRRGREEGREEGRVEGRAEGREEGRVEGRKEGRAEVAAQAARALMEAQGLTAEGALDLLRVDGPLRERVLPELAQR